MSDTGTPQPAGAAGAGAAPETSGVKVPLDDVMIAMDVVDTLRHDERLVERELNDARS